MQNDAVGEWRKDGGKGSNERGIRTGMHMNMPKIMFPGHLGQTGT